MQGFLASLLRFCHVPYFGIVGMFPKEEIPSPVGPFFISVFIEFTGALRLFCILCPCRWRMTTMQSIRFNWGFASAGTIDSAEYSNARPDPIAAFAKPVATHMNEGHAVAWHSAPPPKYFFGCIFFFLFVGSLQRSNTSRRNVLQTMRTPTWPW